MNAFTLPLETSSQLLEESADAIERGSVAPERLETMATVEVGQTPSTTVYEENKLSLEHYAADPDAEQQPVPILLVYALINRPYILDLQPDRSVIRRLTENGFDVYLIDWGEPSRLDASLTIQDYVRRYIGNCADVVRERSDLESIHLLGYCMGGTFSAVYAALNPEKVRTLGLMAAGLCFDGDAGILEKWGSDEYFDPEGIHETYGLVPAEFFDTGFELMDPISNTLGKYARLSDNIDDEEFVENFARMERWLNDSIDMAGATYAQFVNEIYQDNQLYENEFELDGVHVDIENIEMPVIQITGKYDHLVPSAASTPFNDRVPSEDTEAIEFPVGHIGLSVSSSSHEELWPSVCDWYAERSDVESEDATESNESSDGLDVALETDRIEGSDSAADVEAEPQRDPALESVDGVGPAYAERLQEAGIESIEALADADAATLADRVELSEERLQGLIDNATDH